MVTTRERLNGSLKWIVGITTFLISAGAIVFAAGGLRRDISQNTTTMETNHQHGCIPSEKVRRDVVRMETKMEIYEKDVKEIKDMLRALVNKPQS